MPNKLGRCLAVTMGLVFLLCAGFAAAQAANADPKIIEQAKREGKLVWWTTTNVNLSKRMLDGFRRVYPFIQSEFFRAGRGPLLNKILTETIAGRHVWDVLSGSGEMHPILLEKKLVGSYLSSERGAYDLDMMDKAGFWSAVYINPYVLGVNTKLVKKEDVPRSYEALLERRWSGGAISLDSDAYPLLTGFSAAWGKEKATAYLERLAAQKPAVKRGNTERVQLAAAGEYPLVVAYAPTIEDMIQKGAPMDWVPLEPVVVQVNPVELAARAVNPNASKLFIDFMLSKEGQEIIRDDSRVPARKEIEAKPRRLSRGYKRVTVGPDDYKNYAETVKLYQAIFKTR